MLTTVLLFLTVQVSGVSNNVLFVDEFDNEKLPGWDVSDALPPGDVKVKNGKLLLGNNGRVYKLMCENLIHGWITQPLYDSDFWRHNRDVLSGLLFDIVLGVLILDESTIRIFAS